MNLPLDRALMMNEIILHYYIYSIMPYREGQTREYAECEPARRRRRLNGSLEKATESHSIHIYSLD